MRYLFLTLLIIGFSGVAQANQWYSTAHLGFASERQSSTGFRNSSGSMSFVDVGYEVSDKVSLGLRTLMQGAQKTELSYYRMGSGPMILWRVSPKWILHSSLTSFNETGLDAVGDKAYRSNGRSLMFGWEKVKNVTKNMDIVYGGFITKHKGHIDLTSSISNDKNKKLSNISDNSGLSHGVEVAFRMFL